MNLSTPERLRRALARMPAPLVSERARRELCAFSERQCPEVDLLYLEYRVDADASDQVDVSVSAAGFAGRAALAARVAQLAEADAATWAAARDSTARWCVRGTLEASALCAGCLEYDLALDGSARTEPSLFFNAHELSHAWDRGRTRRGLLQALRWLGGERLRSGARALDTVMEALPENFHIAHLGAMFARADEELRFCLAIPLPELEAFLGRLGWRGALAAHADFIALAERGGWISVAFGFGPSGVNARLGVEAPAQLGGEARLLGALEAMGACTPAKAALLRALLDAADPTYRVELSHAKRVVSRAGPSQTKLYLTLAPRAARLGRLAALPQILARAGRATCEAPRSPVAAG